MTVRDLLRHTSGLTYGFFGDTPVDRKYLAGGVMFPDETLEHSIEKLSKLPLLYQPGSRFNYSVSTDVLGYIVQQVAGQPLADFFQEQIFQPLDMLDTAFYVSASKADRLVDNYGPKPEGSGLQVVEVADKSRFLQPPTLYSGGGGLTSTARDYLRFCQMLLNNGELNGVRLLQPETVEAMTHNQLPEQAYPISIDGERPGVGFGLGLAVFVEKSTFMPSAPIGEFGWGGAASTHFWISPRDQLAVVLLTQHMPFTFVMEEAVKPLVYDAIAD